MGETKLPSTSPLPKPKVKESLLDFPQAIKEIMNGGKLFRKEWEDTEYYGFMNEGILSLHKPDEKNYQWVVSDGDMEAVDWIVL